MVDTLEALSASKGRTAVEIHGCLSHHGVSVNAINNRLEHLREMGLVSRQRFGKFQLYTKQPRKSAQQIVK